MPTLADYRQEMLRIGPADLGEFYDIASLTTTTVVVDELKTGFFSDQKYHGYYILRPDAASTADRIRVVDDFASDTGTLTHDGTNYSDTTATDETVELWHYHPRMVDEAVNIALNRTRRMYSTEIPVLSNARRYWLNDLDWVEEPADVERIDWINSPQLSRNRYFDLYNSYDSGALQPDFWALTGSGATMARSTTNTWKTAYALSVTRNGADALLTQSVGLLETGVEDDTLRGEKVTAVLVGLTDDASSLTVKVDDGDTNSESSAHSGGGNFEEISVEHTVSNDATKLEIIVTVGVDGTAYLGECYLIVGELSDSVRRDSYARARVYEKGFEQGESLPVLLNPRGRGGHFLVTTQRSYPQFDKARIQSGDADSDVSDAPLELVAAGAIGRLYERVSQKDHEVTRREAGIAAEWNRRFEKMAMRHLYRWDTSHGASPTFGRTWAAPAATRRY